MPDQMRSYLDFEKPVAELDAKVDELRALAATGSDIGDEIARIDDAARSGDESYDLARSTRGDAPRVSFGRSEMARNLTARPSAVTAIANPYLQSTYVLAARPPSSPCRTPNTNAT